MRKLYIALLILGALLPQVSLAQIAQTSVAPDNVIVHFFGRDDCKFCQKEKAFLADLALVRNDFSVIYHNIIEDDAAEDLYLRLTQAKGVSRITPITVIGDSLIQGWNAPETTGARFIAAIQRGENVDIEEFIANDELGTVEHSGRGCEENEDGVLGECDAGPSPYTFDLPLLGIVDLGSMSLISLSIILGFIDGFNPCAFFVLLG